MRAASLLKIENEHIIEWIKVAFFFHRYAART